MNPQIGTLVTANKPAQENKAEMLTLTGWSALSATAALVTVVLGAIGFGITRTHRKYAGYQMVVKGRPAGSIELR